MDLVFPRRLKLKSFAQVLRSSKVFKPVKSSRQPSVDEGPSFRTRRAQALLILSRFSSTVSCQMWPLRVRSRRPIASYLSQADRDDEDTALLLCPGPLEQLPQRSKQRRLNGRGLFILSTLVTLIVVFCVAMFIVCGKPDARSKDAPFYPSPLPIEHRVPDRKSVV